MLNKTLSFAKNADSFILTGLIILTIFWLVTTVLDLVVPLMNCSCPDMGMHFPASGKIFLHLLVLIIQFVLIISMRRHLKERETLENNLESARARAVDEKAKVAAILAAIGDGVSIQDKDFRITYQNQRARELVGEHVGEYCYRAYHQTDGVCDECPMQRTFDDGKVHMSVKQMTVDGAAVYVENTASSIRDADGNIIAGIEVLRDITARKKAEEEIGALNRNLEQRALELSASNKDLETFNYSLSHDLNSSLTKIFCATQTLEECYAGELDETGKYLVQCICEGGEQIVELTEAMLILSNATRKEICHESVDLSSIATRIISDLRAMEPERRADCTIHPGATTVGDPALLRIVIENLLGNAWKYTRKQDETRIEFGMANSDAAVFFVRDNGVGFDMKDAEKLFAPFQRLHDDADFPGTGVGLATVQRVIERHGGRIWVEAEQGRGATFYFTF